MILVGRVQSEFISRLMGLFVETLRAHDHEEALDRA